jgi:hypothetical protein
MFLYPSAGAKSAMLAPSVQGFQTTTSLRLSLAMLYLGLPASEMTTGALGPPAGVYTRSILEDMPRAEVGEVVVEMGVVSLSTYVEDSRPETETLEISCAAISSCSSPSY